jgi:hypothetical protein
MLYATSIAIAIGLVIVPLFALGSSLNPSLAQSFGLRERLVCFVITLTLLDAAFYCTNKTVFLGALQWQTLVRLKTTDEGKPLTLMKYHVEMKKEIRDKYPIFKWYKIYKIGTECDEATLKSSYKLQVLAFIVIVMVVALILFSLIWWRWDHFFWYLLGSELVFGLSIWLLLRYIPIM